MKKEKADFLEVNELLNRVEKQHEELRKITGEDEPYPCCSQLHQNKPLGSQGVYRLSHLWFMYDFIQLKKDISSKSSSDIGPAYARYYDSHTCHPTHCYYKRKRLQLSRISRKIWTLIL
ncbi:hypothetical protein [Peribacillus simplex]|uniref:hypothetical protein n=1 Tax=Peribacillus simplex TaxID=1478 RepID=UPI003D0726B8